MGYILNNMLHRQKTSQEQSGIDPEMVRELTDLGAAYLDKQPVSGACAAIQPLSRKGKYCGRRTLEGSDFCYWHHPDLSKYQQTTIERYFGKQITLAQALQSDVADGVSMEGAILQECRLGGDFLKSGPNLTGAFFANANLRGAWLSETNFTGAVFNGSDLTNAKLSSCLLVDTDFYHARMHDVKFRGNDLQSVKNLHRSNFRSISRLGLPTDRILEEYPEQAEPMYRELVRYFSGRALFEDASWAAYRASVQRHRLFRRDVSWSLLKAKQVMGKMPMMANIQSSLAVEYLMALSAWIKSGFFLMLTGHGEKPFRVLFNAGVLIVVFAGLYSIPGATTGRTFEDALYFSIVTFSTLGYGDILPKGTFRLVAGTEALSGILFTGLFLFCLSRRTVSRG